MQAGYEAYGSRPQAQHRIENFTLGGGDSKDSICNYIYPVGLGGTYVGNKNIANVPCQCPMLFSRRVGKNWDIDIQLGKERIRVNKFNHEVPFEDDIPVIDICDFGDPAHFDRAKSGIPEEYWIPNWKPHTVEDKHVTFHTRCSTHYIDPDDSPMPMDSTPWPSKPKWTVPIGGTTTQLARIGGSPTHLKYVH